MADELKRVPFPVNFQCGACFHWQQIDIARPTIGEAKRGICFGAPPTVIAVKDKQGRTIGQHNIRPAMPESERACGAFMPLEMANGAANDLNG